MDGIRLVDSRLHQSFAFSGAFLAVRQYSIHGPFIVGDTPAGNKKEMDRLFLPNLFVFGNSGVG